MKALLLTEGGKGIGFGHLTRCISLYQAFLEEWQQKGFIEYTGWHNDDNLSQKIAGAIKQFMPYKERLGRSKIGRSYVDGKGVERILEAIITRNG